MKKSELKEIIKSSFLSERPNDYNEDKYDEGLEDIEETMRDKDDDMDEGMRGKYEEDDTMREAEEVDVEDNEDIDVNIEDEVDIDDETSKSEIEVDSELAGEDSDVAAILGLLTKAQEEASNLGDEKLWIKLVILLLIILEHTLLLKMQEQMLRKKDIKMV